MEHNDLHHTSQGAEIRYEVIREDGTLFGTFAIEMEAEAEARRVARNHRADVSIERTVNGKNRTIEQVVRA